MLPSCHYWLQTLLLCLLIVQSRGYKKLNQLSYTKLPYTTTDLYKLMGGTAEESAYDPIHHTIYVVGEESHLLHVIDISDPSKPIRRFSYYFSPAHGVPHDVEVCEDEIAVALSSPVANSEGHIHFFRTYDGTTNDLSFDGAIAGSPGNGTIKVGVFPDNIKFTDNCHQLVVLNEARAGKLSDGTYVDPEGSITVINTQKSGNPSVQLIDFTVFNNRSDIRTPAKYIPSKLGQTSVAQDLEPEYVAISTSGRSATAYVTLQENDAIATVSLSSGVVSRIDPLPKESWKGHRIDASDRDGGIHMREFEVKSIRQPDVIKPLQVGSTTFLFMAEEGAPRSYTSALHGFTWTDTTTAKSLAAQIDRTAAPASLYDNAYSDEKFGRLQVSTVDGKNSISGKYENLYAFGSRGFSVWKAGDFSDPVYDSDDELEMTMEFWQKSVFNTDVVASTYLSPENLRDTVSDNMGPKINALDVADDNGTVYLVLGSEPTGVLYLYKVDVSSGTPIPVFESITRAGVKNMPWSSLYAANLAGDALISDIKIIKAEESPTDETLVYVVSNGSGSVSIYNLVDSTATPGC